MPQKMVKFEGKTYSVPNDATLDEIDELISGTKPKPDNSAILAQQAANYPTKEKTGVDTSSFMNNLASTLYGAASPFHSPLETAKAVPRMAKDVMESGAAQQMNRLAKGEPLADPMGIGQVAEPALTGDVPGALGAATGIGLSMAAPMGAKALARMPARAAVRTMAKLPTPESLKLRAIANREVGGNIVDDASKAGNSAAGLVRLGRNVYAKGAAPLQDYAAKVIDSFNRKPIGNAVIDDSPAQIAGKMETVAARGKSDQYRPQFTEPSPVASGEPVGVPRPRPQEIPQLPEKPPMSAPDLNKWMNVRESQMLYGKNPGQRILADNLLGADKASTLENVAGARKSVGSQMDEVFKRAEAEGVRFEIESDIQAAIADAKKTIGKSADETFMKALEGVENDIVSRTDDLKSMSPSQAHELEVELGRGVKWTGATSDVQRVLKDIRGRISKKLKTIEGIVPLKERWGDLYEGEQALKSSLRKDAMGRGTGSAPTAKALSAMPAREVMRRLGGRGTQ